MAGIAPNAVTSATLKGWYDASRETAADGTALPTITDRSSYAKNLTQASGAAQPVLGTDASGHRYYGLNGSQFATAASAADWAFLNNAANTIFVVAELDAQSVDGRSTILDTGGLSAADRGVWLAFDNRGSPNGGPNGLQARATRAATGADVYQMLSGNRTLMPGVRSVLAVRAITSSARLHIANERGGSVTDSSITYGAGNPTGALRLGQRNSGTSPFPMTGRIYDAFFFAGDLSVADRDGVFEYLAAKWAVPCWAAEPGFPVTVEAASAYDAFPSVAEAANGDLVAVARRGSTHTSAFGDIVQWRSTDVGETWTPAPDIGFGDGVIFSGTDENCDLRDTGIMRMQNGNLLFTCSIRGVGGSGTSVPHGCRWATSTDNGATWSALHTLVDAFTGFSRCSTRPCQLAGGTLLWPIYGNNTSDANSTRWVKVLKSTDDAATWSAQGSIGSVGDATGWGESSLVIGPASGDVIALVRNDVTDNLYRAVSSDSGATWTAPAQVLPGASSSPQAWVTPQGALAVAQRITTDSSFGYVATSCDEGVTFELGARLSADGPFEYGSPVTVDERVLFVWSVELDSATAQVSASAYNEEGLLLGVLHAGAHLAILSPSHTFGALHAGAHLGALTHERTFGALHAGAHLARLAATRTLEFGRVPGAARQGGISFGKPHSGDPIAIEIFDPAHPFVPLGALPFSFGRETLDELVGAGQFGFSLLNRTADPNGPGTLPLIDNPDLLLARRKRIARFAHRGQPYFQGYIERHQAHEIAAGEEANEFTVVSGRRVDAYWGRCEVMPTGITITNEGRDDGPQPTQDVRHFNCAMAPTDQLFEDDEWPFPINLTTQGSLFSPWAGNPPGWPAPDAFWIAPQGATVASSVPGTDYYRSLLSIDETTTYTIYGVADVLWIDAVTIWSQEQRLSGGSRVERLQSKQVTISAGLHTIAGAVGPHDAGPTGLLLAVIKDSTGEVVYNSNNNGFWHCLPHAPQFPGTTAGHVLELLYVEAASRGRWPLSSGEYVVQLGFDSFVDSAGRPWPRISDISLKIGDSYDKILEQLAEAYIDYRWRPAGLVLDAYVYGTIGSLTNVKFSNEDSQTANVVQLDSDTQNERATALLVRWGSGEKGGQFIVYAAGVAPEDHIEGYLTMGDAQSVDEALLVAVPYLAVLDTPHTTYVAQVQPRREGDIPYADFLLGDSTTLQPPTGGTVEQQVVSISMKQDDKTWQVEWSPEWRDQFEEYEERVRTWLSRLGSGEGAGSSRLPSSSMPGDPFPAVRDTRSYAFGFATGTTGDVIGPVPADVSVRVRDVLLRRGSTVGTTTVEVRLTGVLIATITANDGEEFAKVSLPLPAPIAQPVLDNYELTMFAGNDSRTVVLLVGELID